MWSSFRWGRMKKILFKPLNRIGVNDRGLKTTSDGRQTTCKHDYEKCFVDPKL